MGYDMNGMGVIVNSEGTCSPEGQIDLNGSCSCWNNWEEPPAQWLKGEITSNQENLRSHFHEIACDYR